MTTKALTITFLIDNKDVVIRVVLTGNCGEELATPIVSAWREGESYRAGKIVIEKEHPR